MSKQAKFRFLLFVAGNAPNSACAVANLTALCRTHLPGRHGIEIVDVFKEPKRALAEGIFLTPTLVRLAPLPVRRVVGTLSQTQTVLEAFGLENFVENDRRLVERTTGHRNQHGTVPA